jgi:FlaG/FlaF family flagellin (archaellin)
MKGISTVIATLLMLVITLGLIGIAYGYITGIFGARMAVVLSAEARCGSGNAISVRVRNEGTTPIPWSSIFISGIRPDGTTIPEVACTTAGSLSAGGSGDCGQTLTGGRGTNTVIVRDGGSRATTYVTCI